MTSKELKQFIAGIDSEQKREDAKQLIDLMANASGYSPYLAGSTIGFGSYHYKYESGREGDAIVTGFAPRKQNLVIYVMPGFVKFEKLLASLGKYKLGKSCLYVNKLADIDLDVLAKIISRSVAYMQKKYECSGPPRNCT